MERPSRTSLAAIAAALYFSEGLPYGIVKEFVPMALRFRGVDLTSAALHSVGSGTASRMRLAMQPDTRSIAVAHDAVIRVYDEAVSVIETHEHAGEFKEP